MNRSSLSIAFVVSLAGVLLLPVAVFGQSPEFAEVCHFVDDPEPGDSQWSRISVPHFTVDLHLAHGDGLPGGQVPDTDGDYEFDEDCVPQLAELVFAVAFTDLNGDHVYDPGDRLISKLVDGEGEAGDGVPGPGDVVISAFYPKDFAGSFGSFRSTTHVVDSVSVTETGCGAAILPADTPFSTTFSWRHLHLSDGLFVEDYSESDGDSSTFDTSFVDRVSAGGDIIRLSSDSPSSPNDDFAIVSFQEGNQAFIDVVLNQPCGSGV